MKKFLSILLGLLWIIVLPICVVIMVPICLFVNLTIIDFLSFWGLCAITLISGKGFFEHDQTKGEEDDEWFFGD